MLFLCLTLSILIVFMVYQISFISYKINTTNSTQEFYSFCYQNGAVKNNSLIVEYGKNGTIIPSCLIKDNLTIDSNNNNNINLVIISYNQSINNKLKVKSWKS